MPRSTAAALLYLLVAVSCGETESSEVVMPSGSGESSSGESDESDDGNSPSLGATYVDSYADPDELPWMWSESETDNSYWSYGAEWSYEYDPLEALGFVPEFSGEPSWQSRAIHVQVPAATSAATELRSLLLRRSSPGAHIHTHMRYDTNIPRATGAVVDDGPDRLLAVDVAGDHSPHHQGAPRPPRRAAGVSAPRVGMRSPKQTHTLWTHPRGVQRIERLSSVVRLLSP